MFMAPYVRITRDFVMLLFLVYNEMYLLTFGGWIECKIFRNTGRFSARLFYSILMFVLFTPTTFISYRNGHCKKSNRVPSLICKGDGWRGGKRSKRALNKDVSIVPGADTSIPTRVYSLGSTFLCVLSIRFSFFSPAIYHLGLSPGI